MPNPQDDKEDGVPGLIDMPRPHSPEAMAHTTKSMVKEDGDDKVKTLLDIIKHEAPLPQRIPRLSLLSPMEGGGDGDVPKKLKLVRQQAINVQHNHLKSRRIEEAVDMYANTFVKREILPGWRIVDALVDGIVVGMVVFPWPLWAAVFLVLGMRVPVITRACEKHD